MTTLAKESATRYIAQCEHGTIHLVWDSLSIRLRPGGFFRLAKHVCARTSALPDQDEEKGLGLRLNAVGVRFPTETLATLRDLMWLAMLQMQKPDGVRSMPGSQQTTSGEMNGSSPSFSLN
jgi:hypothetical protein